MDSAPAGWGDAPLEDSVAPLQDSDTDPLHEIHQPAAPPAEVDPDDDEEEEFVYPSQGAPMYS